MENNQSTKFYGIISGKQSTVFAQNLNRSLNNAMVINSWEDINEFQRYVGSDAKQELKGLTAILVTDMAFENSMDNKSRAFAFSFMQSMFKEKELYGVHIILFSKSQDLIDEVNNLFSTDSDLKYEGTRTLLCSGDYTIRSISKVYESPFSLLSYSDKKKREMEEMEQEANEKRDRVISKRGFMMLLGKQQALQDMLDITNRELTVVNRKIIEYATAINNDNLDSIIDDIEGDMSDDIQEQYEKLR